MQIQCEHPEADDFFYKPTKNIEDSLGEVKVKNKTSEAFISNQSEKSNQIKMK